MPNDCRIGRRGAVLALLLTVLSQAVDAQGRCLRVYGTPACNTDSIPAVFAHTGWRTTGLDQIAFRVADPLAEAAFYTALMGWTVRSTDDARVVMDIGNWGTVVFRRVSADSFVGEPARRGTPVRAVVEGIGWDIEPWDAKAVEAAFRARGLTPVAERGPGGYEAFRITDPDGFVVHVGNGKGHARARRAPVTTPLEAAAAKAPFAPTGWRTVWLDHLSYGARDYKRSASFYTNLLGWQPTYDEGSQNELMIGDVGDIIVRGGNPLDPAFGQGGRQGGRIDHISFGITPWDTDRIKEALEARGLPWRVDTSDGSDIHVAQYKSYHTTTPNGYDLQISYSTHDTRLNLPLAVNPRRPGVK